MRWDYQSCDVDYRVWGEYAHEDFYFYPDGFATRVMTATVPSNIKSFETQEFIFMLPQSAYPKEYFSGCRVDLLWPQGKTSFRFPCRPGRDGQDDEWAVLKSAKPEWLLHRIRFSPDDPLSAIQFAPRSSNCDLPGFPPFDNRGTEVTPMYWGWHWPLSRGFYTGWGIYSPTAWGAPSHCSSYHTEPPQPLHAETGMMTDALGKTCKMTRQTFCWLIGMTSAGDDDLRHMAQSFAHPPKIEAKGATLAPAADFAYAQQERRALCLTVDPAAKSVELKLTPDGWCVNPVFELKDAPKALKAVKLDGREIEAKRYAWDGKTLWIEASLSQPTDLRLEF